MEGTMGERETRKIMKKIEREKNNARKERRGKRDTEVVKRQEEKRIRR